jgi:trk system potassium uptake protein TrkA
VGVHVVVVGCGRVGSGLALALQTDGHSVAILDKNVRAFRRLPDSFLGQRLVGSGFDRDDLESAGAVGADALAAVTSGDNTNILTVRIARENYGIARVVARIYDPRRAEIYQRLGIPTVATVTWTIDQVHRSLVPDRTSAEWVDSTAKLVLVERDPARGLGRPRPRGPRRARRASSSSRWSGPAAPGSTWASSSARRATCCTSPRPPTRSTCSTNGSPSAWPAVARPEPSR